MNHSSRCHLNLHWSAWAWAILASSGSQLSSIMLAAGGCLVCPLATRDRNLRWKMNLKLRKRVAHCSRLDFQNTVISLFQPVSEWQLHYRLRRKTATSSGAPRQWTELILLSSQWIASKTCPGVSGWCERVSSVLTEDCTRRHPRLQTDGQLD